MEMLIGGTWLPAASGRPEEVTSPFDEAAIGTVPVAEARGEAGPSGDVIRLAAFEGTQLCGDAAAGRQPRHRPGQDRVHHPPATSATTSASPATSPPRRSSRPSNTCKRPAAAARRLEQGWSFVVIGSDTTLLATAVSAELGRARTSSKPQ